MTEYLDKEKAIEAVKKHSGNESAIIASLVCLPSADVVERKRGKWLRTPTHWVYCSVCNREPPSETNETTSYCPWCGAKMDDEVEE